MSSCTSRPPIVLSHVSVNTSRVVHHLILSPMDTQCKRMNFQPPSMKRLNTIEVPTWVHWSLRSMLCVFRLTTLVCDILEPKSWTDWCQMQQRTTCLIDLQSMRHYMEFLLWSRWAAPEALTDRIRRWWHAYETSRDEASEHGLKIHGQ